MAKSQAVAELIQTLDRLDLSYAIGGSFASATWGKPRHTQDLDISIEIPRSRVDEFVLALGDSFYIGSNEMEEAYTRRWPYRTFQMLHMTEIFKIDVFLTDADEFTKTCFSRKRRAVTPAEIEAWIYSPEDTVLQKIRSYELGNRSSDRQWNDLVQVIEVQGEAFDRVYFREWADKLEIRELAEEALAEAWD